LWLANEVEVLAQQYLLAATLGVPPVLSDEQMAEVVDRFSQYGVRRKRP
jgi:L-fuculose-phosphate aldolase